MITVKISLETSSWSWLHVVFYLGSLIIWPVFIFIYGALYYAFRFPYPVLREFYDILQEYRIFLTVDFWLVLLVTVVFCCLRDVFWKFWVRIQSRNLYYEVQTKHDKKSREEIMQNFPFEEGLPVKIRRKKKSPIEIQNIKKFFSEVSTKAGDYRGFAFSQTENQQDLIQEYYGQPTTSHQH